MNDCRTSSVTNGQLLQSGLGQAVLWPESFTGLPPACPFGAWKSRNTEFHREDTENTEVLLITAYC